MFKKLGLLPRLIIAIICGILIGKYLPQWCVGLLATFNGIFGNFLGFAIPLIILGFVAPGIADLGKGAGKLLGVTVALAYGSTLLAGFLAFFVGTNIMPKFINFVAGVAASNPEEHLLPPYFTIEMPPVMGVMTAILLAFILGIGMSAIKEKTLHNATVEFQKIITMLVSYVIIPLLPIHVAGIFANMTFAGEVGRIMAVFGKVFLLVIACHITLLLVYFAVACAYGNKNFFMCLKNQIPGYVTALGTQSSAATIPVNVQCAERNGISKAVRDFVIPLCATIHLAGSTITITMCSIAVMMLHGVQFNFASMVGFIAMLGITMVAAPGVPGGAIMSALGVLQSMLGFSEAQLGLMIALYIAQDSFGTACNVSGDNAIAIVVDKIASKMERETVKQKGKQSTREPQFAGK